MFPVEAARGEPNGAKAYFGRGNGCLMVFLWFCTVIVVTLIVTMATARM
jgi:hypothetical protein